MKRMILGLLVCLAVAAGAAAETRFQQERDDAPSETCGAIDPAQPCYVAVGQYISCQAKGSVNQMCTKGFTENGVYWCTWVATSANCQCNVSLKRSDGLCVYTK